jgi:hypothetical protein
MVWRIRRVKEEWRLVYEDAFNPHSFTRPARVNRGRAEKWGQWLRDPLSHPDLEAMSLTQLADLPFEPGRVKPE